MGRHDDVEDRPVHGPYGHLPLPFVRGPRHANLAVALHGFVAHASLELYPNKVFMLTVPASRMREIIVNAFQDAALAGEIFVGEDSGRVQLGRHEIAVEAIPLAARLARREAMRRAGQHRCDEHLPAYEENELAVSLLRQALHRRSHPRAVPVRLIRDSQDRCTSLQLYDRDSILLHDLGPDDMTGEFAWFFQNPYFVNNPRQPVVTVDLQALAGLLLSAGGQVGMLDLRLLSDGKTFQIEGQEPRIALVHHGFKASQSQPADTRKAVLPPQYPSLGLLNLARSLESDFGQGRLPRAPVFRYFDQDDFEDDGEMAAEIGRWLSPSRARFVLASIYTAAVERTRGLFAMLDPVTTCLIVGGAHPTVAPQLDYAHIVVLGEGGAAMRHVLRGLLSPGFGAGPDARGINFRQDGTVHTSGPAFDNSLATVPPPAFAYGLCASRTEAGRYRERWWKSVGRSSQIYICTQSCRARCTFCSTYLIHGRLVSRPVPFIEADLDDLMLRFGYDGIQFQDDDLLQHERFDDLLELLRQRDLKWSCNARAEYIDDDLAKRMFAAGCRKVFLGVESLDQRSLDYYRKATTVEMNQSAARALDAAGIAVVCGFILGAPHDTLESSLADIDRMLALPIYFLSASILSPDIGTVEFQRASKASTDVRLLGARGASNIQPRPDLFGPERPYGMPTVCRSLLKRDLNELLELAFCEFFLREETLARIVRHATPDQMDDIRVWYASVQERCRRLTATASLPPVIVRCRALSEAKWSDETT